MVTTLANVLPQLQSAQVDINIHVSAQLNITPFVARQKVNRLLVTEASTGLGSGKPELVIANEGVYWRVPVNFALPHRGGLGQVGQIDVDVQNGHVLVTSTQLQEMVDHAERLLVGANPPALQFSE